MNDTRPAAEPDAGTLRAAMVDRITEASPALDPKVADAMRAVPRHLFVPHAPVTEAYAEQAVITKNAADGAALSCASVPGLVALMLHQLQIRPGHRVLEIGAGTGYNAALLAYLAYLTGPAGHVTTVDVDPEVTAQAARNLDTVRETVADLAPVHVAARDGQLGDADHAPYDRIIVTVGAWDIPPAWYDQLSPGGRLVVPLRWRGQTRTIAFAHIDGELRSDSAELCGFVPMVGQTGEYTAALDPAGHVTVHYDADQPVDPDALAGILDQPRVEAWSTATVGPEDSFDGLWLRLTAAEPGTCRLAADPAAIDAGLCTPAVASRTLTLIDSGSLAYLALRREPGDQPRWTLGSIGHGPAASHLTRRLCDQADTWNHHRDAQPAITARPTDPAQTAGPDEIPKTHTLLAVRY